MPDFAKSFMNGVEAAKAVERARIEIQDIFSEMNKQLAVATSGVADISIKNLEEVIEPKDILGMTRLVASAFLPKETRRYKAIVVGHRTSTEFRGREVARWRQHPNGYPCWLITDGQEVACEDKASLEHELDLLAGSARMGEAVLAVIEHKNRLDQSSKPNAAPAVLPPTPPETPDPQAPEKT
ncbi:hypothetical protein [Piscinibacter terrae]|uniref:hypothetical protein n=1 Tax=Piscinibacter terrae TaxID=2496871 RepID=UPI000F58FDD4|nr:hypothetical protein [Albitalea terrae]